MGYKNILFDLDGTLTDPYEGISNSIRYALGKFGITEDDENKLRLLIGPPLEKSFIEFYQFDHGKAKRAMAYYREYFKEKGLYENQLYDHIVELLDKCRALNKTCIMATSKPECFAVEIARHFKIDVYFDNITGSSLDGTLSDKDEIIKYVIEKNALCKEKTIMAGDRKYDISGAHKNGIHSIAVLYGYGTKEELEKENPTYYCSTPADILKVVQ